MKNRVLSGFVLCISLISLRCTARPQNSQAFKLVALARSEQLWTGVAVSNEGRIFVNYPRWTETEKIAVAELDPNGAPVPFPDSAWNQWELTLPATEHFVCVQSVYIDNQNFLWILDPANPQFKGVIPGGAKLVQVDLRSNQIFRKYYFEAAIAPATSYLNDVRIDTRQQYAYLSESGEGSIVVLNLRNGQARRVLNQHPSTQAEDTTFTVEGIKLKAKINCDGIALAPDRDYLYYQALRGHTLYRIKTQWLHDFSVTEAQLAAHVEVVARTGIADGIEFDSAGNLYFTALEHNAIRRLTPTGTLETVIQDSQLKWPDSFSITPQGVIYVTTSQLHLGPNRTEPYRIFKIQAQ
ncbi:major royal jelly family protein [candidate division KSB1 bacterium]|nr:major royal jelly family protein [candidate division KSB1 bacterium]